ncbi:UNVERIFIED_CONTAM: Homeobox-leucine zipper protein REVOLUTA [Sesamum angustifolium]|uniref:Homeobox-leucine zipper protein REVOLUTA n=1 Tax=Sesamum angustifolium TaxID=2727405 RepID=A0AAW2PRU6_9LAMI
MDVVAKYPVENGGTIELIYTQVCEQSISGSNGAPSSPVALEFVRGRMLVSGYLIRPCERGSTIDLLDHLDLEASSVPEVVRPLYESSELMAKQMIVSELEVIRFERSADQQHVSSGDLYHLQVITGMNDMGFGACSELIFAPIDRTIPNDAALLCSGFRIFLLGSKTGEDTGSSNIAPNDALNARNAQAAISHPLSMLIVAFQFPSEADLQEDVAAMARQYVKSVISSVKNISLRTMSSGSNPVMHSHEANPAVGLKITPESSYFADLADLMCQSYRSSLGVDMVGFNCESTDSMLEQIHHHHYAILCFSFMSLQVCLYANHAALNMLETTLDNLQMLTVDRILDGSNNISLLSVVPTIMQQGYAILPPGNCLSVTNRCVSYAQAVVWKVLAPDGSVHCLALALIDWSFV